MSLLILDKVDLLPLLFFKENGIFYTENGKSSAIYDHHECVCV